MLNAIYLLTGIAMLSFGGEALIRGALGVAGRFGVSPLLSGLLIVGFGTSAPELVVSVNAVLQGQPEIAVGNVVGSNIGNILLILGVCALIRPMVSHPKVLRRDAVAVIAASVGFIVLSANGSVSRLDGLLLLAALAAFMVWAYRSETTLDAPSAELRTAEADVLKGKPQGVWLIAALVVGGLALLIAGSQVFLGGAIGIAKTLGVSDAVIGLTLVAVGTSLPELSISIIAALRGHADVAIGNVLGSNLFNVLGILGIAALVSPLDVPHRMLVFDQWVMLVTAVLLFAFLYTGRKISRIEAGTLLTGYAAYIAASFLPILA